MKYQVLGHKRKIQKGDIPYDVVCEFDDLIQMYIFIMCIMQINKGE